MDKFLHSLKDRCDFYQNYPPRLDSLPVMGKTAYRASFPALNRYGITLDQAEAVALKAEKKRDFSADLEGGITVGLSSGTSGRRSVFLTDSIERRRWAGIVLAHALSQASLLQILNPFRPALRIAFFLRANSNLYRTIGSQRIDFQYFDLLADEGVLLDRLQLFQPDVLIAPATVLAGFAKADRLSITPRQVISVAEVLEERDAASIREKFRAAPTQIYQATEGYIARTCSAGKLHLNEEYLHVEREWLGEGKTRFHPIITDFTRCTQSIVRYRLDDILVTDHCTCECGSPALVIRSIEGRADQVLWFGRPVFPDVLRQALYAMRVLPDDYLIEQHGAELHMFLTPLSADLETEVTKAIRDLFLRLQLFPPVLRFLPWTAPPVGNKQLRIRCITRP